MGWWLPRLVATMSDIRTPFMDQLALAIARGEKWETRRLIKLPRLPDGDTYPPDWEDHAWATVNDDDTHLVVPVVHDGRPNLLSVYPRAAPGDTMLVGEALVPAEATESTPYSWISYRADGLPVLEFDDVHTINVGDGTKAEITSYRPAMWTWKTKVQPAIYCPKWAVRHRRTLLTVHPERLSEITDEGAIAEGIAALGWEPTRAGFLSGFRALHGLAEGDDPWVEVRAWERGEVSDGR